MWKVDPRSSHENDSCTPDSAKFNPGGKGVLPILDLTGRFPVKAEKGHPSGIR